VAAAGPAMKLAQSITKRSSNRPLAMQLTSRAGSLQTDPHAPHDP
jgi:hypothetical protein